MAAPGWVFKMEKQCLDTDNGMENCIKNKKNRLLFYIDAFLINAAYVLTTGVFLSGFVISLEGSDFLVALLNNSVVWTSILSLSAIYIMRKIVKVKRFLIITNLVSRLLACSLVLFPLIFKKTDVALYAVAVAVIVSNILWSIYSVGWTDWFVGCLSDSNRNSNLYKRMLLVRISITAATLGMGFVLDSFNKTYTGFLIVFLISFLLSVLDIIALLQIGDLPPKELQTDKISLKILSEPLLHNSFRKYLIFVLLFYMSITVSSSFTTLYLIKYMGFNYSYISVITSVTYIVMIVCNQFWSNVEKRHGAKFVLKVSGLIAIGEFLVYYFLNTQTYFLLYAAALFSGAGNSGFNASLFNYRFEIVGEKSRVLYESWFKTVYGISVFAAPFIGNVMMRVISSFDGSLPQAVKIQQLYFISFIISAIVILLTFSGVSKLKKAIHIDKEA